MSKRVAICASCFGVARRNLQHYATPRSRLLPCFSVWVWWLKEILLFFSIWFALGLRTPLDNLMYDWTGIRLEHQAINPNSCSWFEFANPSHLTARARIQNAQWWHPSRWESWEKFRRRRRSSMFAVVMLWITIIQKKNVAQNRTMTEYHAVHNSSLLFSPTIWDKCKDTSSPQ